MNDHRETQTFNPAHDAVGIIGLGIMGGAIARNLISGGWKVHGFDTDPESCAKLAQAGGSVAPDGATLARAAPYLILSLPSAAACRASATAIAESGAAQRVVIETSTLTIEDKLAIAAILEAAGHVPLDCPISGTGAQAVQKDLAIYASGDSAAIAAAQPLFKGFARQAHDVGAYGNGSRMKFVANLLVAINNLASAEAMVLGMKAGLDPRQIIDLVSAGVGTSRVFELRAPMMAEDRYAPATMKVEIWQKDMAIIGQFAAALGSPTPLFSATIPYYAAAMAKGHATDDTAAVCAVLEAMAGVERKHQE